MSEKKKNRFYYSKKQSEIDEEMWNMPTRFTFVKTPDGWKQYSEWCSVKSAKCNWEDAKLVYETDDEPEVIIHECIPELIANLEAKLAESEKHRKEAYQEGLLQKQFDKDAEIMQLKQQLAEKEKENDFLKLQTKEYLEKGMLIVRQQDLWAIDEKHNQDKISFAVEQLEKVLKILEEKQFYKKEDTAYCVHPAQIAEYISNQIKQLKEGNNATKGN